MFLYNFLERANHARRSHPVLGCIMLVMIVFTAVFVLGMILGILIQHSGQTASPSIWPPGFDPMPWTW